jgi:hypothetical protein
MARGLIAKLDDAFVDDALIDGVVTVHCGAPWAREAAG